MRTFLLLCLWLAFPLAAQAEDWCAKYKARLVEIKDQAQVKLQLKNAAAAPKKFSASWSYIDFGDFALPVPRVPGKIRREADGSISLGKPFAGYVGLDAMKEALNLLRPFAEKAGLKSDYDYNIYVYGPKLIDCSHVESAADVKSKSDLALAKTLHAPIEIRSLVHAKEAGVIALAGAYRRTEGMYAATLIVRKDDTSAYNGFFYFNSKEELESFLSYLPKLREKSYFPAKRAIQLPATTTP